MTTRIDTVAKGKRAEFLIMAELLREGFNIFQAVADSQGIDCGILSPSGKFYPVQIKSRARFAQRDSVRVWSFPPDMFIIVYDESTRHHWIIPACEYKAMSTRYPKKEGIVGYRLQYTNKNAPRLEQFKGQNGITYLRTRLGS